MNTKIRHYSVASLKLNPKNSKDTIYDKGYAELEESILLWGILEPLTVVDDGGRYKTVIDGKRRLEIAKKHGIEKVPCIVTFGRITEDEKEKFKTDFEKIYEMCFENFIKRSLVPELQQKYRDGVISKWQVLNYYARLSPEQQNEVVQLNKYPPRVMKFF